MIFDNAVAEVRTPPVAPCFPGEKAFLLHDTYGFLIDLTLEMASESGLEVDRAGFTALMEDQRQRAQSGCTKSTARRAWQT